MSNEVPKSSSNIFRNWCAPESLPIWTKVNDSSSSHVTFPAARFMESTTPAVESGIIGKHTMCYETRAPVCYTQNSSAPSCAWKVFLKCSIKHTCKVCWAIRRIFLENLRGWYHYQGFLHTFWTFVASVIFSCLDQLLLNKYRVIPSGSAPQTQGAGVVLKLEMWYSQVTKLL